MTKEKLIKIAINAIYELETSDYEHEAILEYLGLSEKEYKYLKELENEKFKRN